MLITFLSKVKYTISNTIVIDTYEISCNINNRSIPISLYATQRMDRETSIPQGTDVRIFNDLHSQSK